jgi:hypothetical protein
LSAPAFWQNENVNVITIISLLFGAAGAAILVVACWSTVHAAKSRQWSRCAGAIRSSTIETDHNEGHLYRAAVSYVYQVEDQEFIGSRVRFCDWLMLGWSYPAKRIVREFPAGKSVSVYYDSNDPGESVLEPGFNWFVLGSFAFGAIFLLIGVAAAVATS